MTPTCPFCRLPVYLAGAETHPCCSQAQARGEKVCLGCRSKRTRPTDERTR